MAHRQVASVAQRSVRDLAKLYDKLHPEQNGDGASPLEGAGLERVVKRKNHPPPATAPIKTGPVQFADDVNPYRNMHAALPEWPFRWAIIGPSGSGKTHLLLSLIEQELLAFDRLYLVAPSLDQKTYVSFLRLMKPAIEAGVVVPISSLEAVPDIETFEKGQYLVVWDDWVTEKDPKQVIGSYFARGRHKGISNVYLSQAFTGSDGALPPIVRKNLTHACLFNGIGTRDLRMIHNALASSFITFDRFQRAYNEATSVPFNFLYVDKVNGFVRNGFNGPKISNILNPQDSDSD